MRKQKPILMKIGDDYKVEEQVNVKYIKVNPADLVSSEEVETYYKENQKEFTTPEAVKTRHILKKFPDNATDEQKAETKTAAEALLENRQRRTRLPVPISLNWRRNIRRGPSAAQGGALRGQKSKTPAR